MTLLAVFVSALLAQSPPAPPPAPVNCNPPADVAVAAFCAAEDMMRQADRTGQARAVAAFRRAIDLAADPALKKRALEQLEHLYDAEHLNLPRDADPVLRELIAMSAGDLAPMFRLARLQESQELFDAAESTLLAARQQKPDDVAPYKELAQFFSRRAAALSADKDREDRTSRPAEETGKPDKDGVYPLGGSIQKPEQLSSEPVPIPAEITASGTTGSVGIEIVVKEQGVVSDARVVRSVPVLDAVALATVRQWRFAPATLEGRPVPIRMTVVVNIGG